MHLDILGLEKQNVSKHVVSAVVALINFGYLSISSGFRMIGRKFQGILIHYH